MPAFTAVHALDMAMEIEKNGKAFYDAAAGRATDPGVKALFAVLATQELQHYRIFQQMAGTVTGDMDAVPMDEEEYRRYLQATLDNALFGGPDKALAIAEAAQDHRLVLQAAIGFEKDTLLFFYDVRDLVGDDNRPTLSAIISEEKTHLHRLASLL